MDRSDQAMRRRESLRRKPTGSAERTVEDPPRGDPRCWREGGVKRVSLHAAPATSLSHSLAGEGKTMA